jgi:NADPH-dependent curcumin reductase CurA
MSLKTRKIEVHAFAEGFRAATRVAEETLPDPGPGQVLVRNLYAGVNGFFDTCAARNELPSVPLAPPFDAGVEAVGHVLAVGPGVSGLGPGDAVSTWRFGTGYREHQLADVRDVWKVREASPAVVAIRPTGISALVGLEQAGGLSSGEVVAVSGAAGGLGHFAVQVAKRAGNHVIGICGGPEKAGIARRLGCDRVIDYRREDVRETLAREYPRGVDLAFDSAGGAVLDAFVDALAPRGRLVMTGWSSELGQGGRRLDHAGVLAKLYWKAASIRGFQNPLYHEFKDDATRRLLDWHERGELTVLVDPTPFQGLERVADAVEHLLSGRSRGKVVVRLPGSARAD